MGEERLFVIMEVVATKRGSRISVGYENVKDTTRYAPVDDPFGNLEAMWLKPERVIEGSRLKYDVPKEGDIYFNPPSALSAEIWMMEAKSSYHRKEKLILGPEKEMEKTDFQKWLNEAPACLDERTREWISRMPRREEE